jgi:hypothetical protein
VHPEQITDKQIQDLASRFPEEKQGKYGTFAEIAKERGLEPMGLSGTAAFVNARKEAALEMIAETSDVEELALWLEAEEAQKKPRRVVLQAIEDRIDELSDDDWDDDDRDLDVDVVDTKRDEEDEQI